jgi:osmotically-inducible protein OsmY
MLSAGVTNRSVVLLAAWLVAIGCGPRGGATEPQRAGTAAASDAAITTAVQARLYDKQTIASGDVDVATDAGVVTLHGHVRTDDVRARGARRGRCARRPARR